MARSAQVSVKLTVDKKREFEGIAARYGMSSSLLGAYILGCWMDERQEEEEKRMALASALTMTRGAYSKGAGCPTRLRSKRAARAKPIPLMWVWVSSRL